MKNTKMEKREAGVELKGKPSARRMDNELKHKKIRAGKKSGTEESKK